MRRGIAIKDALFWADLQVYGLGHLERVVDLDAEISNRALQLEMPEEKLAGPQIARFLVDQRDLRSSEAVGRACVHLVWVRGFIKNLLLECAAATAQPIRR
jgi:hypothetical protein